ncbi:MAG: DUF3160 domain-containing protein, partial [Phycisphaerae bacterium]
MRCRHLLAFAGAGLFVAVLTHAEAPQRPGGKYRPDGVVGMEHFVGSAGARRLLASNGFVVTDQQFKQIFSAYVGEHGMCPLPVYITTDSAWHAYHVLLEEGVKQLEVLQADRLRRFTRGLLRACLGRLRQGDAAFEKAAVIVAVGAALQDGALPKELPEGPAQRAKAIVTALGEGVFPVDTGVGFPVLPSQFRAQGFYAGVPRLAGYFAARRWYGTVVFRLTDDAETATAGRLAMLVSRDRELSGMYEQLDEPYASLLGPAEDGDVNAYAAVIRKVVPSGEPGGLGKHISSVRKELAARLPLPTICDQLLLPGQYARFAAVIRGFRLLPPRRLPSAVCFQNTTDPVLPGRAFPTGLDFLAASKELRSEAALRALREAVGRAMAERICRADCGQLPDSLHGQALRLLA